MEELIGYYNLCICLNHATIITYDLTKYLHKHAIVVVSYKAQTLIL